MKYFISLILTLTLSACALLPGSMRTVPPETQVAHEAVIVTTALLTVQKTIISLNEARIINDNDTRFCLDKILQANGIAAQLKTALDFWHKYGQSATALSLMDSFKKAIKDLKAGMPAAALNNLDIKSNLIALLNAWS